MKFFREPLVHFLLIGAILFGIFALWGNSASTPVEGNRIVVPAGMVENIRVSFVRSTGRPPTSMELDALIQDYVREEILCREARNLGLDKDDPVVRAELRRRMEFNYEDSATIPAPTGKNLEEYFGQHTTDFKRVDGSVPPLSEVHDTVLSAWLSAQRKAAMDAAYAKLRENYTVVIEQPKPDAASTPNASGAPH